MPARVVRDNTASVLARLEARLARELNKAAFDVEALAKIAIQTGSKTGRIYKRHRRKKTPGVTDWRKLEILSTITHQASAPGEAPATDTGTLANGIMVQSVLGSRLRRRVISSAAYSRILEKNLNRPFLKPALEKVRPVFLQAVRRIVGG